MARIWHKEWQVKINSNHLKGKNMGITLSFIFCLLSGFACFWLFWKCVDWFFKEKGELIMYTALFVLGIAIFGYLMYVLVKPEKF